MAAPDRSLPVAVFDSGVGGLTVLHECLVSLPHEDFLYLGDTARFPYGDRSGGAASGAARCRLGRAGPSDPGGRRGGHARGELRRGPLPAAAPGRRRHRDTGLHALPAGPPRAPARAGPRGVDRQLRRGDRLRSRLAPARRRPCQRRRAPRRLQLSRNRRPSGVPPPWHPLPAAPDRRRRAGRRAYVGEEGGMTAAPGSGPRTDGRAAADLRDVGITPGFVRSATGSALIEAGGTRVICTASVDEEVPRWMAGKGRGWVTAEYSMLPASTGERKKRDVSKGRPDGRTVEIQRLIGRSLRGVVDFEALGERTVWVDCDVLTADGGTRCAAITGGFVALRLACGRLVADEKLQQVPLTGSVAAVSCGVVGGIPLLDLDYPEDSTAEVDANVVMTGEGGLVEVQATAERTPLSRAHLDELLALAQGGIEDLMAAQQQAVE